MKLSKDMTVYTRDGEQAGQIDRVVLDPQTREVTHVILREGWLFPTDVVVSMDMLRQTDANTLELTIEEDDLEALPEFAEQNYLLLQPSEVPRGPGFAGNLPAMFRWYVPAGSGVPGGDMPIGKELRQRENEPSIPEDTIPIESDAPVKTSDGATAGRVKQVYTDPDNDETTHFLVEVGLLSKEHKLIPIEWVESVSKEHINLVISEASLDNLPDFDFI